LERIERMEMVLVVVLSWRTRASTRRTDEDA
jgi:hypothetical protein